MTVNMNLLLKKKETLIEGGLGLSLLMQMGLRDIMVRWVNYMIEKAIIKLNSVIELLEREVEGRKMRKQNHQKKQKKKVRLQDWEIKVVDDDDNDGESEDS